MALFECARYLGHSGTRTRVLKKEKKTKEKKKGKKRGQRRNRLLLDAQTFWDHLMYRSKV